MNLACQQIQRVRSVPCRIEFSEAQANLAYAMMEYEPQLRDALSKRCDLELRFLDGPSIGAHSLKLAMASTVLGALMDDIVSDQITSAAQRRKASDGNAVINTGQLPSLQVWDNA